MNILKTIGKVILGLLILFTFGVLQVMQAKADARDAMKPAPKYKFGDQVKVTLPFYANCSAGTVMELDPVSYTPTLTHCYQVEDIKCPYYNKDLHRTDYKDMILVVNEEDLKLEK